MSWLAEKKATPTASAAMLQMCWAGLNRPKLAMVAISANWVKSIQPRRRPSSGGT